MLGDNRAVATEPDPPGEDMLAAQYLLRLGRVEEAERAYLRILDKYPFDVQALNIVALAAIRMGQMHRARELLERAIATNPKHAGSQHHLGRVLEHFEDLDGARAAYTAAVRLSDTLPAARLHLAALLERRGDARGALLQYTRVMGDMQARGQWTDPSTTPPMLLELVAHAAGVVRSQRHALLFDLLEPLVKDHGRAALARVERALRVYLGEETGDQSRSAPAAHVLLLSRPAHRAVPAAGGRAVDPRDGSEHRRHQGGARVAAAVRPRRREAVSRPASSSSRTCAAPAASPAGPATTSIVTACVVTTTVVPARPRPRRSIACRCAACAITDRRCCSPCSRRGTVLQPHRGVTNTRVVAHLPLIVPPDCALEVGGELHHWQEGRVVVFDDTYEHGAWNRSPAHARGADLRSVESVPHGRGGATRWSA